MSVPKGYSPDSLLTVPEKRRAILPIQGGGGGDGGSVNVPSGSKGEKDVKYTGISLATNSCYMNAGIQMLYSIAELRDFLLKTSDTDIDAFTSADIDKTTDVKYKSILKALKTLFSELNTGSRTTATNNSLYKVLRLARPTFGNKTQEDSQEFIQGITEILTAYATNTEIGGITESLSFTTTRDIQCSASASAPLYVNGYKGETLTELSLPLKGSASSIQSLLHNFQGEEKADENSKYYPRCAMKDADNYVKVKDTEGKSDGKFMLESEYDALADVDKKTLVMDGDDASKRQYYGEASSTSLSINVNTTTNNLVIMLKRFEVGDVTKKIKNKILVNKAITLKDVCGNDVNFELKGIIVHLGETPKAGHYTYFVVKNGGLSLLLNDSSATPLVIDVTTDSPFIKVDNEILENGYVFLYNRSVSSSYPIEATGAAGVGVTGATGATGATSGTTPSVTESAFEGMNANVGDLSTSNNMKPSIATVPLIRLDAGYFVRDPDGKGVKEDITELKIKEWITGEKLLFKHLRFNKRFIREYIKRDQSTKEEFFKFWKKFIEIDGTAQLHLRTHAEGNFIEKYKRDIIKAYMDNLLTRALPFIDEDVDLEDVESGSFILGRPVNNNNTRERTVAAIKKILGDILEVEEFNTHIKMLYDDINRYMKYPEKKGEIIQSFTTIIETCKNNITIAEGIYKSSQLVSIDKNILTELMTNIDELKEYIKLSENIKETDKIAEASLKMYNLSNDLLTILTKIKEAVKKIAIIIPSKEESKEGTDSDGEGDEGDDEDDEDGEEDEDDEDEEDGTDEEDDFSVTSEDDEDDEDDAEDSGDEEANGESISANLNKKTAAGVSPRKTRSGREREPKTAEEFYEADKEKYSTKYIIDTVHAIINLKRDNVVVKEPVEYYKIKILLEFLNLKFPDTKTGDKRFLTLMGCIDDTTKCYTVSKKKYKTDGFISFIQGRYIAKDLSFKLLIDTIIAINGLDKYLFNDRYKLLKKRLDGSENKAEILKLITP